MNESGNENKLKDNGFTDKDISFIKKWSQKDQVSDKETVRRLLRVFLGMSVILVLLTSVAVFDFFNSTGVSSFFISYIITVLLIFLFAPMWLGAKIFSMSVKRGFNYLE